MWKFPEKLLTVIKFYFRLYLDLKTEKHLQIILHK
jgi:hypothetical protein